MCQPSNLGGKVLSWLYCLSKFAPLLGNFLFFLLVLSLLRFCRMDIIFEYGFTFFLFWKSVMWHMLHNVYNTTQVCFQTSFFGFSYMVLFLSFIQLIASLLEGVGGFTSFLSNLPCSSLVCLLLFTHVTGIQSFFHASCTYTDVRWIWSNYSSIPC